MTATIGQLKIVCRSYFDLRGEAAAGAVNVLANPATAPSRSSATSTGHDSAEVCMCTSCGRSARAAASSLDPTRKFATEARIVELSPVGGRDKLCGALPLA